MPLKEAKPRVVASIARGKTIAEAMHLVGRVAKTYEMWRDVDEDFRRAIDQARALRGMEVESKRSMAASDFEDFRSKYLHMKTFDHQRAWIDVIEGRTPEDLHSAVMYEPGDKNFVLINCPPEHSKTVTLSIDYPTYLVCKDPSNTRILIVSETQKRAKEMLYGIKQRMTHPRYHELQLAYAPAEGFKDSSDAWREDLIYLGGELRDSPEKDPTIQALGVGGQIYGARCTHIILDDVCLLSNAHQFEQHIRWIQQEVLTRLGPGGKLIIAGTRVDAIDLYREIRNPDRYPDGRSPWTYLAMPAVLEFADEPEDWVTLWPRSDRPWPGVDDPQDEDGLYPRWSGKHLSKRRGLLDPKTWAMVYQQANVDDTSIFTGASIHRCTNGNRTVGPMQRDNQYHRDEGMDGLYVVCSMDPAMAGDTAAIAYALDLKTHKRYVLDSYRMTAPSPQKIRDLIMAWTDKYKPQAWVIEKNAFQLFLTRDEEIRSYLASRGVIMREHYTGSNKVDPDFGVASLAGLFDQELIELPSKHNHLATQALVEQLLTWSPGKKAKDLVQDLPMALWFAELIVREVVDTHTMASRAHRDSRFVPRYARRNQVVVRLDEYLAGKEGVSTGSGSYLQAM